MTAPQPFRFAVGVTLIWLSLASLLWSGGGPENVFLVVNSADHDSLTIANHFAHHRQVPAGCVFQIAWPQAPFETDLETFRSRILQPTLNEISRRQLKPQIDYIIYSSGFPYAVSFTEEQTSAQRSPAVASLTSLTFFYESVLADERDFTTGIANHYARNLQQEGMSHAFRAQYAIDLLGNRVEQGGKRFYLSMMLGYTTGERNTTLGDVLRYLEAGVQADATQPEGTIYFVRNSNLRSTVRHGAFASVAQELEQLGVRAEVIEGGNNERDVLPVKKDDVQGAMVGFYKLAWGATASTILPGAICENFTSFGGVLSGKKKQTLLTHLLRYGAVASSGTVVEPFAIAAKFPHPSIHVHYARGCSVAEAYYQSVLSPYQLLIVGDPLCQPWAKPPEVRITGIDTRKALSGIAEPRVEVRSPAGRAIRNLNTFIDGRLYSQSLPDKPLQIDTRRLTNGYHELRVVAVEDSVIETQGRDSLGFVCLNPGTAEPSSEEPTIRGVSSQIVQSPPGGKFLPRQLCMVHVQSEGAREIRLYRGRDVLGVVNGDAGQIQLETSKLGSGHVSLQPVAFPQDRNLPPVVGFPLVLEIALPEKTRR